MTVLTKIFVVLVAVLSVVLVSVTVTFVANQENFRNRYDDELSRRRVAEAKARAAQAEQDAAQSVAAQNIERLSTNSNKLRSELQAQIDDLAQARTEITKLRMKSVSSEAQISQLAAGSRILAETTGRQRQELITAREDLDKTKGDLITTVDLAEGHATKIEVLEQELRFNQERLAELIEENTELLEVARDRGISTASFADLPPRLSSIQIDGAVTMVEAREGTVYVQMDIGTNDGVEPKMKFLVHRNWQFLGTVVVDLVDAESASGKMTLTEDQQIVPGDRVLSGVNF